RARQSRRLLAIAASLKHFSISKLRAPLVFRRKQKLGNIAPFDLQFRIVPEYRPLDFRKIIFRGHIEHVRAFRKNIKSMRQPSWDPDLPAIFARKPCAVPAPKTRRTLEQVEKNIQ